MRLKWEEVHVPVVSWDMWKMLENANQGDEDKGERFGWRMPNICADLRLKMGARQENFPSAAIYHLHLSFSGK